eukprot:1437561-Pyramimonas_sp.AAC.1
MRLAPLLPPAPRESSFSVFSPPRSLPLCFPDSFRLIIEKRLQSWEVPHPRDPWPPLRSLLEPLAPSWQSAVVKTFCSRKGQRPRVLF